MYHRSLSSPVGTIITIAFRESNVHTNARQTDPGSVVQRLHWLTVRPPLPVAQYRSPLDLFQDPAQYLFLGFRLDFFAVSQLPSQSAKSSQSIKGILKYARLEKNKLFQRLKTHTHTHRVHLFHWGTEWTHYNPYTQSVNRMCLCDERFFANCWGRRRSKCDPTMFELIQPPGKMNKHEHLGAFATNMKKPYAKVPQWKSRHMK